MADVHAILRLHRSDHSGREIAALLQIDRGTVAKYVAAGGSGSAAPAAATDGAGDGSPGQPSEGRNPPDAPAGSQGLPLNAPSGSGAGGPHAPSGSGDEARQGPGDDPPGLAADTNGDGVPRPAALAVRSAPSGPPSSCEDYRELIEQKLVQGLSAQRIHQDLVHDEGFRGSYYSVRRFVARLNEVVPEKWTRG